MSETTPSQHAAVLIDRDKEALAASVVQTHYEKRPELEARYGSKGRQKCLEDSHYHLSYLGEALAAGSADLFVDYVAWAKVLLTGLSVPETDLKENLEILKNVIARALDDAAGAEASAYVEAAIQKLPDLPGALPSCIDEQEPLSDLAHAYIEALLKGDRRRASELITTAASDGISVKDIYLHVFQKSQREIGRRWQMNEVSVAQEHFCTAATQMIMSQLYPYIFSNEKSGRVLVATCVGGDLHEIGVRMVADFFEMEGWDTFYLGANTPTEEVVNTVTERGAEVLGVSATMTFHVQTVRRLIEAVRAAPGGDRVLILTGGYPFMTDPNLWRSVGADGTAVDAEGAVAAATRLVAERDGS